MGIRWKKNLLWLGLVVTLLVSVAMVNTSSSASSAVISVPVILDTAKTPGSTLSVDVTIEDVEKLFAYEFWLYYNTTVLTATSVSSYDPFTITVVAPRINETAGWVYAAYSMSMGETEGFSTVDPEPIAKIDFTVNALGTSWLELKKVKLTEPVPKAIPYIKLIFTSGFFANIAVENHDIAITDITVPSTVQADEEVNVTLAVENEGDFDETFNMSLYYDVTLIETQTNITLTAGADTTLTFAWNTTGVANGTYTIKAEASVVSGEFYRRDNFRTVQVTVGGDGEETATGQDYTLYIVAAAVIVVVLAILVYVSKTRKPKPPQTLFSTSLS